MEQHMHTMSTEEINSFAAIIATGAQQGTGGGADKREWVVNEALGLLRADACVSFAWDSNSHSFVDPVFANVSASSILRFQQHFQFRDGMADQIRMSPKPVALEQMVTAAEYERSAVFREVLAPDNLYRVLALYIASDQGEVGRLTMLRSRKSPPFSPREIELLAALRPHLARFFRRPAAALPAFTPRETEVAQLIARGCSDRDVARILGIAYYTVRTHLKNALEKSGCANRTELAGYFAANFPGN
ncbi:helix-turn-helix transcriptional regulator [Acidimangrovimonas sediminis]|uniref:helix-turn-helix transcriptional regulator n=1 Tax=Acidimangrovimonas sediminis TaxID=2056283 RepID=UPI001304F7B1|nr:LuxR C-terminal-related transcriptional regulator [Acidimangrovimonas sediminis]